MSLSIHRYIVEMIIWQSISQHLFKSSYHVHSLVSCVPCHTLSLIWFPRHQSINNWINLWISQSLSQKFWTLMHQTVDQMIDLSSKQPQLNNRLIRCYKNQAFNQLSNHEKSYHKWWINEWIGRSWRHQTIVCTRSSYDWWQTEDIAL
jgi:hypothetical protein